LNRVWLISRRMNASAADTGSRVVTGFFVAALSVPVGLAVELSAAAVTVAGADGVVTATAALGGFGTCVRVFTGALVDSARTGFGTCRSATTPGESRAAVRLDTAAAALAEPMCADALAPTLWLALPGEAEAWVPVESAWATAEPLASAAPTPKVTAPAPSQM
jgi:hypothetical protein